ncbi:putative F420-0 ABC transporter substrate-binding protein [Actinotalea sp.]|uniref:putative F420-0 ABC transporter substrate-binding protein n=1 Tax=Actinotalea sp. TaxID=1872145 RepID=UPI00356803DF
MRLHPVLGLTLPPLLLLSACAGSTDATSSTPVSAGPTSSAAEPSATYAPFTADDCGFEVSVDSAPERIVTIKSSATEMVLALGAGDRIVGTAFSDGPVPQEWAAAADGLTELSDKVPSAEVVLATEPDLVYAGWESNLTAEGAGDRSTLSGLGVATFVSPAACKEPGYQPEQMTFEEVFAQIEQMGDLLGVPEAAQELVAAQRAELESITADGRGATALWYSSGDDVPYVGAGIGTPQMIMDAVGLTNIAGSVEDTWTPFSWEQVAQDDPDVIVLVDASWNSAADKKVRLASNPATANLTAVVNERYLVVPFAATEAGVRNVSAASDLVAQLAELDLG